MTIEGGSAAWGGGIYNQGHLTLTDLVVRGNEAEIHGGGIFNLIGGTLALNRSVVIENTARHGGGIFNDATITVANTALLGNTAIRGKGGGLHNSQGGVVAVSNSTISGNASRFGGGGDIHTERAHDGERGGHGQSGRVGRRRRVQLGRRTQYHEQRGNP